MTQVLSRPAGVSARSAGLIRTRPMRDPDFGSPEVMTRRGWWLVALNVLIPGSVQVLAGNRRLGRFGLGATLTMWALVVVVVLTALLWHQALLWLTIGGGWVSWLVLTLIQILCIAYVVLWVVLTFDTLRLVRLVRTKDYAKLAIPLVAVLVLSLCGSGAAYAANVVGSSRSAISTLFGSGGPSLPPSDGYYNVLLLGADSGMGRDSMRYDSISVVSVNATTGKTTIFGIPRDMPHVPFAPGPMHDLYPDGLQAHEDSECGWGSGINQLTNAAEYCHTGPSLYPEATKHGSRPAVEATKAAAEGVLGIKVPYYVFLDMNDFAKLIDALGGIDINVKERLPEGNVPEWGGPGNADQWATGWIEAGQQHMNGDTAQWYARSRYTTSDFDRMRRQRELQDALLKQFTPQNVLTHFNEIAAAGSSAVDTDLPQDKLPEFFDLMMKAKQQKLTTIDLTPANGVDEFEPDWNQIHAMVKAALHPAPTPTPTG